MRPTQPIHVLFAEGDPEDARRLIQMLRVAGRNKFRLRRARRLCDAQKYLQAGGADVALLDLWLPDARGLEVMREAQRAAPGVPLVLLSHRPDESLATEALKQGAQDFLVKSDLAGNQLARALSYAIARQQVQSSLRSLSLIDELTRLYNRRGFITLAEQQLKLTARRGLRSSLVFVDVDDLKHVNDTFGHREGDHALQQVADAFRECLRDSDIVARLGGDEFCALLTDASESNVALIRERLNRGLAARNALPQSRCCLSASIGIVEIAGSHGLEVQLARADAQMYEQKRHKRASDRKTNAIEERSPV